MDAINLTPLQKALALFGSQTAIAEKLGIRPQAVQQWSYIPEKWALDMEQLSDGQITAREILEDVRAHKQSASA